jgi:hypothetical protein
MAEWKEHPLGTAEDVQRWWRFFSRRDLRGEGNVEYGPSEEVMQIPKNPGEITQNSGQEATDLGSIRVQNPETQSRISRERSPSIISYPRPSRFYVRNEIASIQDQNNFGGEVELDQTQVGSLSRSKQLSAALKNVYY